MSNPASCRQIRVFISSTFGDMKVERNHLATVIFPQLRKLCESRGVDWGEVDFRWGVTDEEKAEGKVLPIVLAEIDKCHPYFIGLLGERYGQAYRYEIPVELAERFPWLAQHRDKSLTELEMLHGVLNSPAVSDHAFFYFRDPAYTKGRSDAERADFVSKDATDREKLAHLKDRIRQRYRDKRLKYPPRENYANPEALGQLVLADFTQIINDLYPGGPQLDPLDREALDHEAYAQSRERVYIGRQEYFDRLNTHAAANDTQPLVVLGESGSGKSALLANWVARYRQEHPDVLVLQHYIGATPYSADWAAMLRRLMGELKRRLGIQQDIPEQPNALRNAFPNWLYMAAAKGRVVLVLDALNQLEDREGAPDLVWLPPVLPENVRLIVSTLPGRALEEINKRHWSTLQVELLSGSERRQLIAEYLAQHAKRLGEALVERIATAPPSANPLYLRVLLDELRLVHTHEELEERIGGYLKAQSPYELYEKVIARWEQDYEGETDLVGDTLSLLWAARRGLTETELLQALGKDGKRVPRATWSPLFLAMSDALVSRGGLLTFAHDFLREAVKDAYLSSEQNQHQAHLQLADYFDRQPDSPRRIDELPWQLAEANEWKRLRDLLADHVFFTGAWPRNQFGVKTYWTQLETQSEYRMLAVYNTQVKHPELENDKEFLYQLGILLLYCGHPGEASFLQSFLIKHFETTGDLFRYALALGAHSSTLYRLGSYVDAQTLAKEQERISRQEGFLKALQDSLNTQAMISADTGDLEQSLRLHREQETVCIQIGDDELVATAQSNQAWVLRELGDLKSSLGLHKSAELVFRRCGELDGLQNCLGNQGLILWESSKPDEALALHKEAEIICRKTGNQDGLQRALGNQALILKDTGDVKGALHLYEEKIMICRQLGNLLSLSIGLGEQALVLHDLGSLEEAMRIHKEEEQICRKLNNLNGLQRSIGNQGLILSARGDLTGALRLYKQKEQICRQLRLPRDLAISLINQASTKRKLGRALEGLPQAEEALRIATLNDYQVLARQLEPILNAVRQASQ